mmetsp:Transcript_23981/g.37048  ORF Transcript_23981/g.37048 Transcript_23981/m.37048 type:complete len:98 (+) Transcript_23981:591-884(+)
MPVFLYHPTTTASTWCMWTSTDACGQRISRNCKRLAWLKACTNGSEQTKGSCWEFHNGACSSETLSALDVCALEDYFSVFFIIFSAGPSSRHCTVCV